MNLKKIVAEGAIAGVLALAALGLGTGVADAKPHGPNIPWIPGPGPGHGHGGDWVDWKPGDWVDWKPGDGVDVGDWIPPWWWFVPPPPPPLPPLLTTTRAIRAIRCMPGWQLGEVAQNWVPWEQGDQGENEQ